MTCGDPACGCKITYDPKVQANGKLNKYYRCANGRHVHGKLKYAAEDEILSQLGTAIDAINMSDERAAAIAEALNKTHRRVREDAAAAHRAVPASPAWARRRREQAVVVRLCGEDG